MHQSGFLVSVSNSLMFCVFLFDNVSRLLLRFLPCLLLSFFAPDILFFHILCVKFLNVPTCFFPLCPLCGSPCLCSCIFYPCSRFSYRSCMKVSSVEVDVSFCRRIRWSNTHFLKIQRFYCHMCIISLVGLYRNAVAGVKVGRDQCFPDDVC